MRPGLSAICECHVLYMHQTWVTNAVFFHMRLILRQSVRVVQRRALS